MKLNNFFNSGLRYGFDAIASDEELATDIQLELIWLKLLDPPADGKFGPVSADALTEFQELLDCKESGFLGSDTAKKLIETSPDKVPTPNLNLSNDLASNIIKYMEERKYFLSIGAERYNIVYVEGMDEDGSKNNNDPNEFNDIRLVIEVLGGKPTIIGKWEATTEPGFFYTDNPMNPDGAARIAFGQYKAWEVGTHYGSGSDPHEALIQTADIQIYRDLNQDMIRTGDKLYTGRFEIDQHWGYDYQRNDISYAGAGCLVGRTRDGHREFMELVKQDKRYRLNEQYRFITTIIPGVKLPDSI